MKWKTIQLGDNKTKKRFALFPTKLDDGNTIWFESFYSDYEYTSLGRSVPYHGMSIPYTVYRWVRLRNYQLKKGE